MITKEDFLKDVSKHEMKIKLDNGIFRHLSFSKRGDGTYSFEITTFPNYLVITGDCGSYIFKRREDMFEFFRSNELKINIEYWSEKVEAKDCQRDIRIFSPEKIEKALIYDFNQWTEGMSIEEEDYYTSEEEFNEKIIQKCCDEAQFNALGIVKLDCGYECNPYEFNHYKFSSGFIWCLYAIVWAIQQYDKEKNK